MFIYLLMTSNMNPSEDEHSIRFKHSRAKIMCKSAWTKIKRPMLKYVTDFSHILVLPANT